jgi:hypothetical protein
MKQAPSVENYLAALEPAVRADVDRLRTLVLAADPALTEEIKWNAPSFAHEGQDRVTLGLDRKGGYRIVLHRGAKVVGADGFSFIDDTSLASWPACDRGVIALKDRARIESASAEITRLIGRWIAATR